MRQCVATKCGSHQTLKKGHLEKKDKMTWPNPSFSKYQMFGGAEGRGRIFSHVRPFYEQAVSNLDRSMHRSLWV